MARREGRRYDCKLGSFLQRTLPTEDGERICTTEPCVASHPKEKRVHRSAVLGHRCLYLVDVPPRSLKASLQLEDVESVRLLDDLPDFLEGKERERTTHVQICYRRIAKESSKGLLSTISSKSPSIIRKVMSKKGSRLEPRRTSTPPPSRTTHHDSGPSLSTLGSFVDSYSTQSLPLSAMRNSQPQYRSRSLSPTMSEGFASQRPLPVLAHSSPPAALATESSPIFTVGSPEQFSQEGLSPHCTLQRTRLHGSSPLVDCITPSSLQSVADAGLNVSNSSIASTSSSPEFLVLHTNSRMNRSRDATSLYNGHQSGTPSLNSFSPLHSSSRALTASSPSLTASSMAMDCSESRLKTEKAVMDLYILSDCTDFYHQLYSVWEDLKIKSTLEQSVTNSSHTSLTLDHFSQQYSALKGDLLSSTGIEASAELAQELCIAAQRYFVIRKMFWEDCELFEYCVSQLQSHLSPKGKRTGHSRADEVEFSIILTDLLYQMLREAHPCPGRLMLLTRDSGKLLLALARTVIHVPPLTTPTDLNDPEEEELQEELTEKACGVLFELLRLAQQAKWPLAPSTAVSMGWLVDIVSGLTAVKDFCHRLVSYANLVIGKRASFEPVPQKQVTLYHIATILNTFTQNSPKIVHLLHQHFMEEFRYFVSISRARQKLPESNPLTKSTLELLQKAKARVLKAL